MSDFSILREQMVDTQIRPNGITEYHLISAFLSVPKEVYVPSSLRKLAYIDTELTVSFGKSKRSLHDPRALARMMQAADLQKEDSVLEIAPTIGYSAAVMAQLAATVTIYDEDKKTLEALEKTFVEQEIATIFTAQGDLDKGYQDSDALFNVIIIHGAIGTSPEIYFSNLAENGRLICIEVEAGRTVLKKYEKIEGYVSGQVLETLPSFSNDFLAAKQGFEFS